MKRFAICLAATLIYFAYGLGQTSLRPRLLIQDGHSANAIEFSRDGKLVATAGDDATINIWDTEKGILLRTLYGHTGGVRTIAFSSEGDVLVSGSVDRTVRLWDVASGNLIRSLQGHSKSVECVDVNQVYRKVVSSDAEGVKVWDIQSGRETLNISAHTYGANFVKFAVSDRRLLIVTKGLDDSTSGEYRAKIWDAEKGNLLRSFENVTAISVSGDGESFAIARKGNYIQFYNTQSPSPLTTLRPPSEDSGDIKSLSLSGKGRRLAVLNEGSQFVSLLDISSGKLLQKIGSDENSPQLLSINFNGNVLATDGDGFVIWDAINGGILHKIQQHTSRIYSLAFNPDGSMIAVGYSNDSRINLWEAKTGARTQVLERYSSNISSISFSPDGQQVVSGGYDPTFKLINAKTGEAIRQFGRHAGWTRTVVFSPDGKSIASGSDDHLIKLWDAASGRLLHTLSGHNGVVFRVVFSPDGTTLASGGEDRIINLWDVRTGSLKTTLDTPASRSSNTDSLFEYAINSLAFSPDGRQLVSANDRDGVKLWDVRSRRLLRTLEGEEAAFSPNNQLISIVKDGVIKLWDIRSGRFLRTFSTALPIVSHPTFSPNSKLLIASSGETVVIWSVGSGELLLNLLSFHYNNDDQWIAYTPDGYYTGSPNCEKYISWAIERGFGLPEIRPSGEFSKQFNRSDIVIAKLSPISQEKTTKPLTPRSRSRRRT